MLSLKKIQVIAFYEAKNLFRSWFFRIFLMIAFLILIALNMALFILPSTSRWLYYGIPSSIPYLNILLFSIVQGIIVIFMASDFLKYDYKLDTTEVIYIRSMTNADYIFGKVLGILFVFFGLNLSVLLISFIFNFFFIDSGVVPIIYFLLPALISIPALIFMAGLTFIIMIILRSQAITFIVLLGISALTQFFLSQNLNNFFDFIGFNLPLLYSDFTGFSDITGLFIQRGMYFFMGSAFIFGSVLLLKRLPQSRIMTSISAVFFIVCLAGSIFLAGKHITNINKGERLRADIIEQKEKYKDFPTVSVDSYNIDLKHLNKKIEVSAELHFTNKNHEEINDLIFSINPGLKVKSVTSGSNNLRFSQEAHILNIKPEKSLKAGETSSIKIEYAGKINENACYPETDENLRRKAHKLSFYNAGKRYSFITPEYVMLTPESNWYPRAGINGGYIFSGSHRMDFSKYTLSVKTSEGHTVISQGSKTESGNGEHKFASDQSLSCLSLLIGKYEKKSISIDNIEYSIYYLNGHDYFTQYFDKLGDGIIELVKNLKSDFENTLELKYPFTRLALIETPVQFFTYPRYQTQSIETVLPEQILLPEKAVSLSSADFKTFMNFFSRMGRRWNREMSPEETQEMMFQRFVRDTFLQEGSDSGANRMMMRMAGGSDAGRALSTVASQSATSDYSVFPLYYSYTRHVSSEKWPMFNTVMEYYLIGKVMGTESPFRRFMTGLSDQDRANLALSKYSLSEIVENPELVDNYSEIVKTKSTYLFSIIEKKIGKENFESFIKEYLNTIKFNDRSVEDFMNDFENKYGYKLNEYLDSWMNAENLPAFIIDGLEAYEILDKNQTRYQIFFNVTNLEPVDGIIKVEFRTRGGGFGARGGGGRMGFNRGGMEPEGQKTIELKGNESKGIGLVLESQPFMMTVNTMISRNLPSTIMEGFQRLELNEEAEAFDGEIILDKNRNTYGNGTIIVDNEDRGFTLQSAKPETFLQKLFTKSDEDGEEYTSMNFRNLPKKWQAIIGDDYYGTYRLSAHYIKAGTGNNKAIWTAQIPRNGLYDVYYYSSGMGSRFRGRGGPGGDRGSRDRGGDRGGDRGRNRFADMSKDYHFTVTHDDGVEEITLDLSETDQGWIVLGTFYFSKGNAKVELSDKSKGRMILADAVRWTERQ